MEKVFLSCLINQQQVHYDVINQDICSIFPGLKFRLQVGWNTEKVQQQLHAEVVGKQPEFECWLARVSSVLGPADKLIVLTVCSLYLGHPAAKLSGCSIYLYRLQVDI